MPFPSPQTSRPPPPHQTATPNSPPHSLPTPSSQPQIIPSPPRSISVHTPLHPSPSYQSHPRVPPPTRSFPFLSMKPHKKKWWPLNLGPPSPPPTLVLKVCSAFIMLSPITHPLRLTHT